jgi:hypothetical protein
MKLFTLFAALLISQSVMSQVHYFTPTESSDSEFKQFAFEIEPLLINAMDAAVISGSEPAAASFIQLPLPNGVAVDLRIMSAPIMAPELREKFPEIQSFRVEGDHVHGRVGWTYKGFHGILFTSNGTVYIDPASNASGYSSYYRDDYTEHYRGLNEHQCYTENEVVTVGSELMQIEKHDAARSGDKLRKYRLALACTGEYAQFHGGTVSGALSAMVVTMNRVSGVYEREFAITFELIGNNDDIIYLNAGSDPYTNNQGGTMLGQNISNLNSVIGSSNFDIGHVFSTGGGGIAGLGVVCGQSKARGVTGLNSPTGDAFDIDFVCHEMGHQFDAGHTQNSSTSSCNRSASDAYEPGSASTIMGYAGVCSPSLQGNSDDYFHAHSYDQVIAFAHNGSGNSCASSTNTGNSAPQVTVANGGFFIPIETPFRLDGSATDQDGDDLTYCWEEMDLGPAGHPDSPSGDAPIFRSWNPVDESYRVFPKMLNVVLGNTVLGETYPTYDRDLSFRLVVRDENSAGGGVGFDEVEFEVSEDAGPFVLTSAQTGESIEAVNGYLVSWDVAGTDVSPVNCQNVNIDLCKFNSATLTLDIIESLAASTSNDGSESVSISLSNVGNGYYIRVSAADNVFFNIGGKFSVIEPSNLEEVAIVLNLNPDYFNGLMALTWNDDFSSESNWYIEKSISNNTGFTVIDTLIPNSTSYLDYNVIMYGAEYYYRVYADNSVSTSDYSNEVVYQGLGQEELDQTHLKVYPNPTDELLYISGIHTDITYSLYSSLGAIVKSGNLNGNNPSINVKNLAAGVYLLQLGSSNSVVFKRVEIL